MFKENIRQTIHTNHYRTIHATMFEKNNLCTVLPDLFAGLVPSSGACCWCCCCCRCCRCCSRNAAMPPMFTLFFFVGHGGSMTAKCLSVCRAGTVLPQHSDTPFYTTATNSRRCEKKKRGASDASACRTLPPSFSFGEARLPDSPAWYNG